MMGNGVDVAIVVSAAAANIYIYIIFFCIYLYKRVYCGRLNSECKRKYRNKKII